MCEMMADWMIVWTGVAAGWVGVRIDGYVSDYLHRLILFLDNWMVRSLD